MFATGQSLVVLVVSLVVSYRHCYNIHVLVMQYDSLHCIAWSWRRVNCPSILASPCWDLGRKYISKCVEWFSWICYHQWNVNFLMWHNCVCYFNSNSRYSKPIPFEEEWGLRDRVFALRVYLDTVRISFHLKTMNSFLLQCSCLPAWQMMILIYSYYS